MRNAGKERPAPIPLRGAHDAAPLQHARIDGPLLGRPQLVDAGGQHPGLGLGADAQCGHGALAARLDQPEAQACHKVDGRVEVEQLNILVALAGFARIFRNPLGRPRPRIGHGCKEVVE